MGAIAAKKIGYVESFDRLSTVDENSVKTAPFRHGRGFLEGGLRPLTLKFARSTSDKAIFTPESHDVPTSGSMLHIPVSSRASFRRGCCPSGHHYKGRGGLHSHHVDWSSIHWIAEYTRTYAYQQIASFFAKILRKIHTRGSYLYKLQHKPGRNGYEELRQRHSQNYQSGAHLSKSMQQTDSGF